MVGQQHGQTNAIARSSFRPTDIHASDLEDLSIEDLIDHIFETGNPSAGASFTRALLFLPLLRLFRIFGLRPAAGDQIEKRQFPFFDLDRVEIIRISIVIEFESLFLDIARGLKLFEFEIAPVVFDLRHEALG